MAVHDVPLAHPETCQMAWPPSSHLGLEAEIAREVALARAAQPAWAATSVRDRLAIIRRFRHAIAAAAPQLLATLPGMVPHAVAETLAAEVIPLADACRFLERTATRILSPRRLRHGRRPLWLSGVTAEVRREPFGVVLVVAPANYPFFLPGVHIVQALVAGNAVVCKPGQGGSGVVTALAQQLMAAGLDSRLIRVLPESVAAGQAAVATGVDKVVLTGSAVTGVAVLTHLAPQLVPATLELGGCDAAFVQADADLDVVVQALVFGLRLHGGATCIAPRRVFVAQELATPLTARLTQAVRDLAPCTVAPATLARLHTLITAACDAGATLCAGTFLSANTMTPLLVANASPSMPLLQEDVFAPVLSLVPVAHDEAALAAASHCPYALGATIFGNEAAARALALRVHAGVVVINDVIVPTADPRLPFGGRGRSGFGVTRGAEGLLELTVLKAVAIRRGRWRPHFETPLPQDAALFQAYLMAVHGGAWQQRLLAGGRLLRQAMTRMRSAAGRQRRGTHGS